MSASEMTRAALGRHKVQLSRCSLNGRLFPDIKQYQGLQAQLAGVDSALHVAKRRELPGKLRLQVPVAGPTQHFS